MPELRFLNAYGMDEALGVLVAGIIRNLVRKVKISAILAFFALDSPSLVIINISASCWKFLSWDENSLVFVRISIDFSDSRI